MVISAWTFVIFSPIPLPFADFRKILAKLRDVPFVFDELFLKFLLYVSSSHAELRDAINDVHDQVKAIEPVPDHHIERGGR